MQSCLDYQHHHHPQGSPHVTFRQYSPHSSSPPQPIKEEEPSGALTMASPASGSGGGVVPAVSSVGGGFCGSQHYYLPVTKNVDSLPRIGMLGGSTPGMYSKALVWSPTADSHGKTSRVSSSANNGSVSPSIAHYMSMVSEHVSGSPHDIPYLWNGVENKNMKERRIHATITAIRERETGTSF
ncbi:uncharacterized protein NPIL_429251 [Nephila pilipes]|uniref:Uncharacterized protein n=1 Tax=Nephila pilipes TaxID=299642 RepID=A0A8X6UDP7_NEPPI|nr:uncharacterized protein NPIL_429251 [Nephila pilipes]